MATNPTPPTSPDPFGNGEIPEALRKQIESIPPELNSSLGDPNQGPLKPGEEPKLA